MTEPGDPARESALSDLRDELGEQFLRAARDEPRSRVRRRLRYAGITLVCGLLVVPAAVAISGGSSDAPPSRPAPESGVECAPPKRFGGLLPGALASPPVRFPGLRATGDGKARVRAERKALQAGICPIAAPAPMLGRRPDRVEKDCVAIAARQLRDFLGIVECAGLGDTTRLGVPGGRPPKRAEPPAALRSDCLEIRALGDKHQRLEARPCRDALVVPAEPPRSRLAPRR